MKEVESAFDQAVNEEKITNRAELCQSNSVPLVPIVSNSTYEGLGKTIDIVPIYYYY